MNAEYDPGGNRSWGAGVPQAGSLSSVQSKANARGLTTQPLASHGALPIFPMDSNAPETTAAAPQRPRRIRTVSLLLIVAVLSFVAGVLLFLRVGLDDHRLAILLVSRLERSTGRNISLVSAHLSWLSPGTARLSLRGLEVRDRSGSTLVLRVPRVTLEVNVARALSGTFCVNLARVTEPVLGIPAEQESRTEPLKSHPQHGTIPAVVLYCRRAPGNRRRSRDLHGPIW